MIKAFRYKLRTFGIEIDGPADLFCDIVAKMCYICSVNARGSRPWLI